MFPTARILLFVFCFWTFISDLSAQEKYRAVHWGLEEGLSEDSYNKGIKDAYGFMWFGSQRGLNRLDGTRFKTYMKNDKATGGLKDDYINRNFVEDSLHNIWIGTNDGLARYELKADSFSTYLQSPGDSNNTEYFIPFWATRDEILCWESSTQIISFNIHTFKKKVIVHILPSDSVGEGRVSPTHAVFDSSSNTLWVLKGSFGDLPGGGLLGISLSTGKRDSFYWPCFKGLLNHNHFAEGMCFDHKRNSIWLASPDGLVEFTLADRQFHQDLELTQLSKAKNFHQWASIDIDKRGRIWMIASVKDIPNSPWSILIYDPTSHSVKSPFRENDPMSQKAADNPVYIYCGPDGIIWTASWSGGIYQLIPISTTAIHNFAVGTELKIQPVDIFAGEMFPADSTHLWMSSDDHLHIFDTQTGKIETLQGKDLPGFGSNNPISARINPLSKKAWITGDSPYRFYEIDLITKACSPIQFKNEAGETTQVSEFGQSVTFKEGLLIVCSLPNHTAAIYQITPGSKFATPVLQLNDAKIWRISSDHDRYFFLDLLEKKKSFCFKIQDGKSFQVTTPLDTLGVSNLEYDESAQTYWTARDLELYQLDKNFRIIRKYVFKDNYNGAFICGLVPDNSGNVWFNTYHSLVRLDFQTGKFTTLTENDGLLFQRYSFLPPITKDFQGDLYFAGEKGISRISPEKLDTNVHPLSVYINSLEINQHPYKAEEGINELTELYLRHDENKINIETGVIDFFSVGTKQIRYRLDELEGKTGDWQYAPNYYTIRYEGLAPGKYQLVIQASGDNKTEYRSPGKTLNIQIFPPFWNTWWFRILSTALVIAILYGIIQYRSRSLKEKNIQLEEKVLHRTKELKHSLEELKETQTQLIQREKMASLGELTAGIAHEIQNPLNFVNNFSELNKELIDEMEQEIENGNLTDLKSIAHNIRENQLKINQHGKRADAIVKGMLQHSRASTGIKEPTDINALADEYLRLSYHGLRAKDKSFNADFETRFDPALREINIIPQDIGRVLLNIYNNAFYAVHEKQKQLGSSFKPKVTVTTQFISATNETTPKAEIRVRDNGSGIPQKVLDKIFQPFFTTKPTGEGTGLGLSLSYDIITKAHGGSLKVDTREGEYSEFIIEFPITGS